MTEMPDDPLFGLLADIAQGVAALAGRIDALEVRHAEQQLQITAALATIAEIATRTYYAAQPTTALPDAIINATVMDAMIERWPSNAVIGISKGDQEVMRNVGQLDTKKLDQMIVRLTDRVDQDNAGRLRRQSGLKILNQELDKRIKANHLTIEQERPGRER